MKQHISHCPLLKMAIIFFTAFICVTKISAQDIASLRANYDTHCTDVQYMRKYTLALRQLKPVPQEEYTKISNNYALLVITYTVMKFNPAGDEMLDSISRTADVHDVDRLELPLTDLRKTQLNYLLAMEKKDLKQMTALAKHLITIPMPSDNMCDPLVYGSILQKTFESGTLDDSRAFVAWLRDYVDRHEEAKQFDHIVKDGEGYIMLKEYEEKHP